MGLEKGFATPDYYKTSRPGMNGDTPFDSGETAQIAEMTRQLADGIPFTFSQRQDAVLIFTQGVETPATRADAVARLLTPVGADVLHDVFENTWTPRLSFQVKNRLEEIAREPDLQERIRQLGDTVLDLIAGEHSGDGSDGPVPANAPTPLGDLSGIALLGSLYGPRSRGSSEVEALPLETPIERTIDPLEDLIKAHEVEDWRTVGELLARSNDAMTMMERAGKQGWALLIDLAGKDILDSRYQGMAVELLNRQGDAIVPVLQEAAKVNPVAGKVARFIESGEWPGHSMHLQQQLDRIMQQNDSNGMERLMTQTADPHGLCDQLSHQGEDIVPLLIRQMENGGRCRTIAMETLYRIGPDAIHHLRIAKSQGSDEVRNDAGKLLRLIMTGEDETFSASGLNHNPFSASPFERWQDSNSPARGGDKNLKAPPTLNIDYLKFRLANPETANETLHSLNEMGQPAIHAYCRILISHD